MKSYLPERKKKISLPAITCCPVSHHSLQSKRWPPRRKCHSGNAENTVATAIKMSSKNGSQGGLLDRWLSVPRVLGAAIDLFTLWTRQQRPADAPCASQCSVRKRARFAKYT